MVNRKKPDLDDFLAEAADLLQSMSMAPNIKAYTPHEKQALFHASQKKKKLYIGGNRSGKTTGGVCEAIWRATCTHPYRPELNAIGPNRGRVVAVDFVNGVEGIIIPQYKQWLYPSALRGGAWETAYDKSTKVLNFSNKSTIEFRSYDQDLDKFAGTSRHWTHFDEEPPRPIWIECMARLIDTEGEFWITMTPVEGMTWVYDDLYETNVGNPDGDTFVIEINTLENPYLSSSAIQEFAKSVDKDDISTRIGGAFVQQGGRIYKNFDPEPGNAQVLPDTIDEPATVFKSPDWLWIMALDHGLNNPTAVLWIAVDPNGFAVVFDEYYQAELTIDQYAKAIKQKIREHGRYPDVYVADPSIQNRNAVTGTSIWQEYEQYGLPFTLGNNDVKSGIIRAKKYFNKYRYPGDKRYSFLHKKDAVKNPTDEFYRCYIDPRCSNFIHELKRYRWKTYADKKKQFENNAYDEPHKKDDHACDAFRYAIMTRPDLVGSDTGTVTQDQVNSIVNAIGERISRDSNDFTVADPNSLRENEGWVLNNVNTGEYRELSGDSSGWEFDSHMGGYF